MERKRKKRKVAIIALCLTIIGLSIGFAALSQTLTINGVGTVKGNTWSVIFEDLSTPTKINGGLVNSAKVDTTATIVSGTTISFDVSLTFPEDKVTYEFKVTNNGTVDAKVKSIILNGVPEAATENVNYTLTYADGTPIVVGDTLDAAESKNLKLIVEFIAGSSLPSTDVNLSLGATIVYEEQQ